jgi:hypothetical protein
MSLKSANPLSDANSLPDMMRQWLRTTLDFGDRKTLNDIQDPVTYPEHEDVEEIKIGKFPFNQFYGIHFHGTNFEPHYRSEFTGAILQKSHHAKGNDSIDSYIRRYTMSVFLKTFSVSAIFVIIGSTVGTLEGHLSNLYKKTNRNMFSLVEEGNVCLYHQCGPHIQSMQFVCGVCQPSWNWTQGIADDILHSHVHQPQISIKWTP